MVIENGFYKGSNKVKMNMVRTDGYNPSHYVIYVSILSYRNTVTNDCFPTNDDIVESSGTSIATVKRSLRWLKDNGFILVNSGTSGRASSYYFPKEDFYNNEGSNVVTRKVIKSEPKEEYIDIDKIF